MLENLRVGWLWVAVMFDGITLTWSEKSSQMKIVANEKISRTSAWLSYLQYKHGFVCAVTKVTQLSFVCNDAAVLPSEMGTKIFFYYVPCVVYRSKLIYKTNSSSTKICAYRLLVCLLHFSARLTCHHQGVLLVAKVAPFKIDRCSLYSTQNAYTQHYQDTTHVWVARWFWMIIAI